MPTRTITRRFRFEAGHRVLGHESRCKHLHGHSYVAWVEVTIPELDPLGRVIDFGELKRIVGTWIDANWDHNVLLHADDPLAAVYKQSRPPYHGPLAGVFQGKEPYVMVSGNPTAENIAEELFHTCEELLEKTGLTVVAVKVQETENCTATFRKD
jgi:6-pyruvoyltetrahydropterin/6-carboxytetrahydropterin synthase